MTDTQQFTTRDMPKAERRKLRVGDIWQNAATCSSCGDKIRSKNRHDFVRCSCGKLAVDGGSWYAKRAFETNASFVDDVIMYDDV